MGWFRNLLPFLGANTGMKMKSQLDAGEAAADVAEQNARRIQEETEWQIEDQRRLDQATIGRARAVMGASGFSFQGTPLDVLAESARQAELNLYRIQRSGFLREQDARTQGKTAQHMARMAALQTGVEGVANLVSMGGGTLLGGGGGSVPTVSPVSFQYPSRYRGQ